MITSSITVQFEYLTKSKICKDYFKDAPHFFLLSLGDIKELMGRSHTASQDFTTQVLTQSLTFFEVLVAAIILTRRYGPLIGMAGLGGIFVISVLYNVNTSQYINDAETEAMKLSFKASRNSIKLINNYETIQTFSKANYELKKLQKVLNEVKMAFAAGFKSSLRTINHISLGQQFIIGLGYCLLTMSVGYSVHTSGFYSPDDFIIISYYLLQFATPLCCFCRCSQQDPRIER